MTRAILICLLFFTGLHFTEGKDVGSRKRSSDNDSTYSHIISAYPLSFISSSMKAGYEVALNKSKSLHFIASFATSENSSFYDARDVSEFTFEFQPRFYVLKNQTAPLDGFFMAPYALYRNINFKVSSSGFPPGVLEPKSASIVNIGYILGYQKIFGSGIVLGVYGGGGLNVFPGGSYQSLDGASFNMYSRGITPHLGINIGFGI